MIVLKWLGKEKYFQNGHSPVLVDINTKKHWDWGKVELALDEGKNLQILGEVEEEEE